MSELKNEEYYKEIINGKIYYMSSGVSAHFWSASKLGDRFKEYFRVKDMQCEVSVENLDVFLNENNDKDYVTPDVMVFCDLSKLDKRGYKGVPELIIEVLSYSTRDRDIAGGEKFKLYERAGVKEYWVCSYNEKSIQQYVLFNGKYECKNIIGLIDDAEFDKLSDKEKLEYSSIIKSYVFSDLEIDLKNGIFYKGFNL